MRNGGIALPGLICCPFTMKASIFSRVVRSVAAAM
jgi:hypothetical protein